MVCQTVSQNPHLFTELNEALVAGMDKDSLGGLEPVKVGLPRFFPMAPVLPKWSPFVKPLNNVSLENDFFTQTT